VIGNVDGRRMWLQLNLPKLLSDASRTWSLSSRCVSNWTSSVPPWRDCNTSNSISIFEKLRRIAANKVELTSHIFVSSKTQMYDYFAVRLRGAIVKWKQRNFLYSVATRFLIILFNTNNMLLIDCWQEQFNLTFYWFVTLHPMVTSLSVLISNSVQSIHFVCFKLLVLYPMQQLYSVDIDRLMSFSNSYICIGGTYQGHFWLSSVFWQS